MKYISKWVFLTLILAIIDVVMMQYTDFETIVISDLCMTNAFLFLNKFDKENI